jgi:hypothetical protein
MTCQGLNRNIRLLNYVAFANELYSGHYHCAIKILSCIVVVKFYIELSLSINRQIVKFINFAFCNLYLFIGTKGQ